VYAQPERRIECARETAEPNGPMNIPESPNSTAVTSSGDADAVFALHARDCLDLFDSPDRAALRWCADAKCTRVFIDRSRGQRRRWCGMKGCGDRAKAAAYRRRQALPLG